MKSLATVPSTVNTSFSLSSANLAISIVTCIFGVLGFLSCILGIKGFTPKGKISKKKVHYVY